MSRSCGIFNSKWLFFIVFKNLDKSLDIGLMESLLKRQKYIVKTYFLRIFMTPKNINCFTFMFIWWNINKMVMGYCLQRIRNLVSLVNGVRGNILQRIRNLVIACADTWVIRQARESTFRRTSNWVLVKGGLPLIFIIKTNYMWKKLVGRGYNCQLKQI